ncbi:MAG: primosomal protein N' [Clostridia bacterium]|nr:primosomal protein N' [Clostridia bacterium]
MFAEVIVNLSVSELNRTFDYGIPEGMDLSIGTRVLVPFGARRGTEIGYVVGIKETSDFQCKDIIRVVDSVFDERKLNLAKWMAKKYFCNLSDTLKLLVPPGTGNKVDNVKAKKEKWASLAMEIDLQQIKSDKQRRIVSFLLDNGEVPVSELLLFTDTTRSVLTTLEKNGIVKLEEVEVSRNPFANKEVERSEPLPLTERQQEVLDKIKVNEFGEYLLYGVTGSGKTEIYLQLIDKVLKSGKTAVVLVPEISLTPQITNRFLSRFGDCIAILHSRLSPGERYDEWRKIKEGKSQIVIGARSAIFAPLENIGVIIIDEEHDASYKSETTPKYEAREVARYLAKSYDIPVVLGSATPDLRTYYKATNGEITLLELPNRISNMGLPDVQIVDLREELASGNKTVFSRKLYEEINQNLKNKEQTMLFLNRRGYSTFVMCRDCGYVVKCDQCDVAMTYHLTRNKLLCHYCGKEQSNVFLCPSCGSKNIRYFGTGTQKIEAEIKKYFPTASVIRMDVDTTRTKNAHEMILSKFQNEKIDILLGTQMITKGHDFENVTLVGVLAADSSINISDYRANERTFQLLTQVAGRAGRGEKKGRAIIQTYMPDEFSILAAKEQDYKNFYKQEIIVREKLKYPPFCDIIIGVLSGEDEEAVKREAERFYRIISSRLEAYKPMPAPISKINGLYRYRVLAKELVDEAVVSVLASCLEEYYREKPNDVRLSFDINPNSMV